MDGKTWIDLTLVLTIWNVPHTTGQCSSSTLELTAITAENRIFTSPRYPNPYPANSLCSWKISTGFTDHRVTLTITVSQLEEYYSGVCAYDVVRVGDGPNALSDTIVEWCGDDYPSYITSTGPDLFVQFITDSVAQRTGFSITYQSFELGTCPNDWCEYNGFCYRMRTQPTTWVNAQYGCMYDAANLLSISSDDESDFLQGTFGTSWNATWLGLERVTLDTLKWTDRTTHASFHNWKIEFSEYWTEDEDCAVYEMHDGTWSIQNCENQLAFICKKNIDGSTVGYKPWIRTPDPIDSDDEPFNSVGILGICVLFILVLVGMHSTLKWKMNQRNRVVPMGDNVEDGAVETPTEEHELDTRTYNLNTGAIIPTAKGRSTTASTDENQNTSPCGKELTKRVNPALYIKRKGFPPLKRMDTTWICQTGVPPVTPPPGMICSDDESNAVNK
ncbi:uncharacterized protein LOC102807498 [Saccoglossus kowalevskii]|uniref:Uncharacterized protein LOC102807498 n=1 Tax=Saccoglossus kowalevskii TaxID=10224 RepID=A0ABM0MN83_SACKO|nr:PREDICTED: uncharacterized protein LOC102807498 [Saccoglossus kowalevskii]